MSPIPSRLGSRNASTWWPVLLLVAAGCVDLTPPWQLGRGDASDVPISPSRDTGTEETGGTGGLSIDGANGAGGRTGEVGSLAVDGATDEPIKDGSVVHEAGASDSIDMPAASDAGDASMDLSTGSGGRGGSGGTTGNGGASGSGGTIADAAGGRPGIDAGAHACLGYRGADGGANAGISSGLTAYYSCDQSPDSTTLPDFSGHANSATLHGASSGTAGYGFGAGKVNSALLLNAAGKGYVDLPAGILAGACETTIAAWVYLNSQSDWQRIWDFGVAPSAGVDPSRYMFLTGSNSVSKVIRFAITIQGTAGEELVEGETAVPAGEWHHVVVVLGPAGAVLYLNGVQVGSNSNLTLRPADLGNTPNNYIGRSQYPKDPYLDGKVDEFRVYDRALSADEVAALYGYGW